MTCTYCIQEIHAVLTTLSLPNPTFLASFLIGLLTCQKANFAKIAHAMPGDAKPASQEMRLRRYLDHPHLCFAPALAALLPQPAPWILAIDRTNWRRGATDINLLTLAVIVGKTAIPLLWCNLAHPGNSDTAQRIALLQQFITLFGVNHIRFLTADREFLGEDWLAWLHQENIPFVIRIRKSDLLTHSDGTCQEAFRFFTRRGDGCRNKKYAWTLWGTPVFVGGKKQGSGDWLIVVSNRSSWDVLALYRLRWGIETLFQALKGRGFDLEGCCSPRIERFLGLLALAFVWCLRSGMYLEATHPSKPLPHGRLPLSWFRRGLDYLHRLLVPLAGRAERSGFDRVMLLLKPVQLPAKFCL
jgi:hypothetical protein